jgi:thiamine pyrophosphokinase
MKRAALPEITWSRAAGRARPRPLRAAALALTGATADELARAIVQASAFDPEPALVAVDGGIAACRALRREPELFVGDLDSARKAPEGVRAVIYPKAKAFSDLAGALVEVRRLRADVVAIAGLLGGRLDHEWANLLEVGASAKRFDGMMAVDTRGLILVTAHGVRVAGLRGRTVSLFAFGRDARVTLTGARWPLSRARLAPGSLGLSNVARGAVTLTVHSGTVALVVPGSER